MFYFYTMCVATRMLRMLRSLHVFHYSRSVFRASSREIVCLYYVRFDGVRGRAGRDNEGRATDRGSNAACGGCALLVLRIRFLRTAFHVLFAECVWFSLGCSGMVFAVCCFSRRPHPVALFVRAAWPVLFVPLRSFLFPVRFLLRVSRGVPGGLRLRRDLYF